MVPALRKLMFAKHSEAENGTPRILREKPRGRLPIIFLLIIWLALSVCEITTSSLRLNFSVPETNTAKTFFGQPQTVRGDEWVRSTPYSIGRLQGRWTTDSKTPLEAVAASSSATLDRIGQFATHWDSWLLQHLGGFRAFAAIWWLPFFGTLIFGYLYFLRLGVQPIRSWIGSSLFALCPVVAWWSFSPLEITYPALAAGYFLLSPTRQNTRSTASKFLRHGTSILSGGLGSAYFVRLPFGYVPWGIPLTTVIFMPVLVHVVIGIRHRVNRLGILTFVTTSVTLLALVFESRRTQVSALLNTVYPGLRRTAARGISNLPEMLWTGPYSWIQQTETGRQLISQNQSEMARGFFILVIPVLAIATLLTLRRQFGATYFSAIASLAGLLVCLAWTAIPIPTWTGFGYILKMVPIERMDAILGLAVIVPLILALEAWESSDNRSTAFVGLGAVVVAGVLTYRAGTFLQSYVVPNITGGQKWLTTVLTAAVVLLLWFYRNPSSLIAVGAVGILSIVWVNPITQGPGDLARSEAAHLVNSVASRRPMARWATDDQFTDALVAASGARMLSGQQTWGPNVTAWQRLDPQMKFKDQWNRGGSFVIFRWDVDATSPKIESPQADFILVYVNPCAAELDSFSLRLVMSSWPLEASCLKPRAQIKWYGLDRWLYVREINS